MATVPKFQAVVKLTTVLRSARLARSGCFLAQLSNISTDKNTGPYLSLRRFGPHLACHLPPATNMFLSTTLLNWSETSWSSTLSSTWRNIPKRVSKNQFSFLCFIANFCVPYSGTFLSQYSPFSLPELLPKFFLGYCSWPLIMWYFVIIISVTYPHHVTPSPPPTTTTKLVRRV